jgi:hypothetical protein
MSGLFLFSDLPNPNRISLAVWGGSLFSTTDSRNRGVLIVIN